LRAASRFAERAVEVEAFAGGGGPSKTKISMMPHCDSRFARSRKSVVMAEGLEVDAYCTAWRAASKWSQPWPSTAILLPLHVAHTETVLVTAASSGRNPVTPMGPAEVLGSRGACAGGSERSGGAQGKPTSLKAHRLALSVFFSLLDLF